EEYEKSLTQPMNGRIQPYYIGENVSIGDNEYIGPFTYIGRNSRIGKNLKLYPGAYIGENVVIGDNAVIHAGVKIYDKTIIGNNCSIFANAVIGGDGFGFAPQDDGSYRRIPQLGNVIIEDDVSIGSNTTIDRATIGSTYIRKGVKLDNLIQIAHNVDIGQHTVIAAQTGISGSTKIGEHNVIAGQVGIVGHIKLANRTKIGAQAGVSKTVKEEGQSLSGSPATDLNTDLRMMSLLRHLPELEKRVKEIENIVKSDIKDQHSSEKPDQESYIRVSICLIRQMSETQQTSQAPVSVSGVGLHTGVPVTMTFVPAPANHSYKFQRVDLPDQPIITADVDNVVDLSRGTTIEENGARVHTVEHTLAALVGLQIDNVLIQLDGPEPPIMDGSSIKFVEALQEVGMVGQNAYRDYFEIPEYVHYKNPDKNIEIAALPLPDYRLTVMVDYNSPVISSQHAFLNDISQFPEQIANCRTFVFLHELEELYKQNLIKGGDLANAIVIADREVTEEE